jgi:LAO/AO transport system kinase
VKEVNMSLAEKILNGDLTAASRLITDIDDEMDSAIKELKELYPKTGKAWIIGITGPPGTGKSTLVDKMVGVLRRGSNTQWGS